MNVDLRRAISAFVDRLVCRVLGHRFGYHVEAQSGRSKCETYRYCERCCLRQHAEWITDWRVQQ